MEDIEVKPARAKVIGLKALLAKKYDFLEGLKEAWARHLGRLVMAFTMIVWGQSGNGKSSYMYQLVAMLMEYGNVLYVSLEEGTEATAQMQALRSLNAEEHGGKILFADHTMTYSELNRYLKKKKSARYVVIDSLQYWDMDYGGYKRLKEAFPKKGFIFVSHAEGKNPAGSTAKKIRYDVGIKVRVEGFVAFGVSRYGGNKPYVIFNGKDSGEGAWKYYGKRKLNALLK